MNDQNTDYTHLPECSPDDGFFSTPEQPQPPSEPPVDPAVAKGALRSTFSRLGWAYVAITAIWIFLTNLIAVVIELFNPGAIDTAWANVVAGTLPLYVVCTPLLLLMVRELPREDISEKKKKLSVPHFLMLFLMAQTLMLGGSMIGNTLMDILSALSGINFENSLNQTFEMPLWLSGLFTVILAPIFEELIFRKLLLDRMIPHGEVVSILLSGLLFGAFHGNFYQFFYAAMLGCLLAYVYIRTRQIHHCMLLHAAVNFVGGILPTIIMDLVDYDTLLQLETLGDDEAYMAHIMEHFGGYLAMIGYSLFQYGAAIAGLVLALVFLKKFVFHKKEGQLPTGSALAAGACNPGMIAAWVISAGMFALSLLTAILPQG